MLRCTGHHTLSSYTGFLENLMYKNLSTKEYGLGESPSKTKFISLDNISLVISKEAKKILHSF